MKNIFAWRKFFCFFSFFKYLRYCWGNIAVLIVLANGEFFLRLLFLCSSTVIVIKMIINVRSWKFNNLEWQQHKSWFKRLLVNHITLYPSFVHRVSVVCASFSIKVLAVFILFFYLTWLVTPESKDASKSKGRRGVKNSATAAKVALMKLKLHASGDKELPQVKFCRFNESIAKWCSLWRNRSTIWKHINLCYFDLLCKQDFHLFLPCRQKGPTFRCIFQKTLKFPTSPCSFAPNGVSAKSWIMQLL